MELDLDVDDRPSNEPKAGTGWDAVVSQGWKVGGLSVSWLFALRHVFIKH